MPAKKKLRKRFYGPKLLVAGIGIGVVLATVGSVAALNGWFGGAPFRNESTKKPPFGGFLGILG